MRTITNYDLLRYTLLACFRDNRFQNFFSFFLFPIFIVVYFDVSKTFSEKVFEFICLFLVFSF